MAMVKKYKKKPVIVDVMKYENIKMKDAVDFCEGKASMNIHGQLIIETLEGRMRVQLGDYIIKGVQGEFYPCKPDIFEQTYEEVAE